MEWVDKAAYIRDKLRITRTAALVFCFYLNWDVYQWYERVVEKQLVTQEWMTNGIMMATTLLTGAVFKLYTEKHPTLSDPPTRRPPDDKDAA